MKKIATILLAIGLAHAQQATQAGKANNSPQKNAPARKAAPSTPGKYGKNVPKPTFSMLKYGDHQRNVLDFWQAKSPKPTPLVLFIHGGGWVNGSKEKVETCIKVKALLDAGISVAAINYRFVPQAKAEGLNPPVVGPLHDSARALQFLRHKAKEWNIDPVRVGLTGSSAGACTSLWLAYHDDLADPRSSDPIARQSTRPLCIAVLRAQTTLDPKQAKEWIPNSKYGGHAFGKSSFAEALKDRESLLPWIATYSPYALASKDDPPVAIFYSTVPNMGQAEEDPTHSANHGIGLQRRCDKLGISCLVIHPGIKKPKHKTATDYLIHMLTKP
jgi:acetyl esterase/lipase